MTTHTRGGKKKIIYKGFQEEGESGIMKTEEFFFFLKLERVCRVGPPG